MDTSTKPIELPDLDDAPAEEIVIWAIDEFFPDVGVACSMQDALIVDLATKVEPKIEVFFLQTMFHFPETIETARRMQERYSLNLIEIEPVENAAIYFKDGVESCCADRKVIPLERHLSKKRAWIAGIRRADGAGRENSRAVEWDAARDIIKINPIVSWSDDDVANYIAQHDIIVNPLRYRGYDSIGCAPCTLPGRGREGRWSDTEKTECGLHSYEPSLARPNMEGK